MKLQDAFKDFRRASEALLLAGIVTIVGAMIVPLPPALLDLGLALNLALSAALLVGALNAKDALQVSSFPTLLLCATLFRLALNVSSTRLALAEGHAGRIIQAFGEFVVQGNYVVGAVVFCILTLVQFLVVAKGAERVAEVSARFTLDAMPGKQMSIDADLRSGAIDQALARGRRLDLERESQMFGAMDGAMKFVKGDVIAGLVIVLVNLVGGTAIGVLQAGMGAEEALQSYALIAIGDGLVSQLPSLCLAVAAGLVVTRVAPEGGGGLGLEIGRQFFGDARALFAVAGVCALLAVVPGMPGPTFLLLGVAAGAGGWRLRRRDQAAEDPGPKAEGAAPPAGGSGTAEGEGWGVSPLTLDLASDLGWLASEGGGGALSAQLERVRQELYLELGVRVPTVQVRTGAPYLRDGGFALLLDEVPCGQGQLPGRGTYALAEPAELGFLEVAAERVVDPETGQVMGRISDEARACVELAQIQVRTGWELLGERLTALLRRRAAHWVGLQEVQGLLDGLDTQAPSLVREALAKVPLALLTEVLRKLVEEEVSIRNLKVILEALVRPTTEGDAGALAEHCRAALHRYLSHKYAPTGSLYAYLLDPAVEEALRACSRGLAPDPAVVGSLLEGVRRVAGSGRTVVLAAPEIRRTLRRLCEGACPDLAVVTYAELNVDLPVRPLGRLSPA